MLNYIRYIIAILLTFALFYTININISEDTIKKGIDKKIPLVIQKKGFELNITSVSVDEISKDNIVSSTILGKVRILDSNIAVKVIEKKAGFLNKFFNKEKLVEDLTHKYIDIVINSEATPILNGSKLSFKIKKLTVNNFEKLKSMQGIIQRKLEKIEIPIKSLEKYKFFMSVKNIQFDIDGSLDIEMKINPFILLFLIPLFLLREIGLLAIMFYQKFLSPRKGYSCAKNHVHKNGTCSQTTKEAFKEGGFISGMKEYKRSTKECREAYKSVQNGRGDVCEAGVCAGCDGLSLASAGEGGASVCEMSACDASACDIGGCDIAAC